MEDEGVVDEPGHEGPSKSQIKRQLHALQTMAEQLVTLPRGELEQLGLGEATWTAIDETARIKDQRALRRHYKRIAGCLARENTEPLQSLLDGRARREREASARHHWLEHWRERLIAEGDAALGEFLDAYPAADRQALRQLVRAAQRDVERAKPDAPRRLFRLLRDIVDAAGGTP